jgi:ATP-dependent DNA helicase RecQ
MEQNLAALKAIVSKHWGYSSFRPLQEEAMRAVLDERDSVVVLPTGGGKSLCYQAPAVLRPGTTVVVSPLIALMKDQVDSLHACGVPATQIDSSLSAAERFSYEADLQQGALRLLFVSPERLAMPEFCALLRRVGVRTFAIDEAHCISHWGHDFRPEYRQMGRIKELFPGATVHAYTATATEQVRRDICTQLNLKDPLLLVGAFDRPNLSYRVLPRYDQQKQVREVLDRHANEAGIIYCLRRKDVDELSAILQQLGYRALGYHAGMTPDQRRKAQEAFKTEACDIIVATVAFGMGIDRSNIRFVLHTGMPKSIEHYQQETGRAGRDGLEAECVLLHSGRDYLTWKSLLEKSAQENGAGPDFLPGALKHLDEIDRYARGVVCRHRALVQHFGQSYAAANCAACDLCLGDVEMVADAVVIAQKILSCIARVQERFGINHVVSVLRGENTERVRSLQHDRLTTFGLLQEHPKAMVRDWIYQLLGQEVLRQEGTEYPILRLNDASWEVMRKQREVRLIQLVHRQKGERAQASRGDTLSWENVDKGLFEKLRAWRTEQARQANLAPYIVFSDATLRDLARIRPSTLEALRLIYGIGEVKERAYGAAVLQLIQDYCGEHGLALNVPRPVVAPPSAPAPATLTGTGAAALALFRPGASIEEVIRQTQRTRSTVVNYLCEYIRLEKPVSVEAWVTPTALALIAQAVRQVGSERLKPIYIALGEKVPYDEIRVAIAYLLRDGEGAG